MPIQLPNLDNKTFDDLMKEMIVSIPKYSRDWTNLNPSDPGITILELLAWVSESLIYRANRIPENSYMNFLALISGSYHDEEGKLQHIIYDKTDNAHRTLNEYLDKLENGDTEKDIQEMKAEAQKYLTTRYRAVTEDDFEELTLDVSPDVVKRAEIISSVNLVKILVVIDPEKRENSEIVNKTLIDVQTYLEERRLLGTVISVEKAEYTNISLKLNIVCENYAKSNNFGKPVSFAGVKKISDDFIENRIAKAIFKYLDDIAGGPAGEGWPYGRNLLVYELFYIIEKIEGVRYVKDIFEAGKLFPESGIEIGGLINLRNLEIIVEVENE